MTTKHLISPNHHPHSNNIESFIGFCVHVSKTVNQLKQTHTRLLRTLNRRRQLSLLTQFLTRLLRFPGNNLRYARHVFDQIPHCEDQFLWTSIIRSHALQAQFSQSISLYAKMHRAGVPPTAFTFSSALTACARAHVPAILEGKQIHSRVIQSGLYGNKVVETALLDMYAKCGVTWDARTVFDQMGERDVVASTAMICGYTKTGMMDDARQLFDSMEERNVNTWTAIVAGYTNYGDVKAAKEVFDKMPERNSVAWVAMIAGYGKCGDVSGAQRVFDDITGPDASCWAAMVACYAQNGYSKEAIEMYRKMREANVRTNEVAMVGAISACTQLGDAEMAITLAEHVEEGCCGRTLFVSNALIHMHAKCGCMDQAWREFNRMNNRDVISYTALITALADHGKAQEALDLFSKMQKEGIKPNQVTFIGVLNACSHAGLVEAGCEYFELMTRIFGIGPLTEHYACMVDLLGRAGRLEKAYMFIVDNESAFDAAVWGALLGACRVHGNVDLGEIAARHLFKIEPKNTGNYVLLASIYASISRWDDAERVRKMMNERRMPKSPGCSWISMLR